VCRDTIDRCAEEVGGSGGAELAHGVGERGAQVLEVGGDVVAAEELVGDLARGLFG
jgi:hypothetical protein